MASNEKATRRRRAKGSWFFACFGIHRKTTYDKKANKSGGGRKSLFKLCMPRIKVIVIRKKRVSFDAKTAAIKASHNMIMLEANKVQQLKLEHASITEELDVQPKGSDDQHDLQSPRDDDEPDVATCHKQEPAPTVTNDSLMGVSIMIITIIIMSIWGRLCAILCMSAWLYCVSLLRRYKDPKPNLDNIKIDMAAKLYKKKAVLEGLLQRGHKTGIGVS